jgi:hypothetical protein
MANVIAGSITALNSALKINGCEGSPSTAWSGLPVSVGCKQYTACPWTIRSFSARPTAGPQRSVDQRRGGVQDFLRLMNPLSLRPTGSSRRHGEWIDMARIRSVRHCSLVSF